MKKMSKLLALMLALVMVLALFAGCNNSTDTPATTKTTTPDTGSQGETTAAPIDTTAIDTTPDTTEEPGPAEYVPTAAQMVAGKTYDETGAGDYQSLYSKFGKEASIADVEEDPETGLAYYNAPDGNQYELGLDFLTMAMVYNTSTEGTSFATEDEVYAEWWKFYITRWNHLLPEIPLYSNEYYDVYNAKIKGVEEHPTNPFWGPASALIDWSSEKEDGSFIMGSSTDLSGKFRYSSFGSSSPGSSDNDVYNLITGLETVVTTKEGGYEVNPTVTKDLQVTENDDGTATFTITIYDDLKFSDGSPVTAKNYLYFPMAFSTPIATEAASRDARSMLSYVGFEDFDTYNGTEGSGSKVMTGVRLLGDYQFSVTVKDDYYPYFYAIAYAAFSPTHQALWAGEADIADDGEGCYWTDNFYTPEQVELIKKNAANTDNSIPYAGPYTVESFDAGDKSAVLKLNPEFKGNYEGTKPSIETVVYKKIISETQLDDLKAGGVDCLAAITGGAPTKEAISMADESNGAFVYTHYSRAGYGKMGFRADYGPVQFTEVRQAIAFCMDRATFAKDFTGGYGGVVDGPYYTGSWMYKAATAQGMLLDAYDTSVDSAIAVLEEGGWIYNAEGGEYTEGVRYKKIPAEYATENDINYKSMDGAYTTTKVGDDYYMPLVLNWFGTVDNEFSDLLVTGFETNDNINNAGFKVYKNLGDFAPMLDELYQQQVYGFYSGTPMYCVFNFATGFNSATYDYSFNMTIDPAMYDDYSAYYIKDAADIYWNN
jgi:ABC-type transport system substrate-binding protein